MSARGRTVGAVGLGLVVIAGLAAWLLSGADVGAPPSGVDDESGGAARTSGSAVAGTSVVPAMRVDRRPAEPPLPSDESAIEGELVFDSGWPIRGWTVMPVERVDEEFLVALGEGVPDGVESGDDGRFTLRFDAEPAERLVAVLLPVKGRYAGREVVAVEGGEVLGRMAPGRHPVIRVDAGAHVRVIVGDGAPGLWVRPVDAATGRSLADRSGVAIRWTNALGGGVEREAEVACVPDEQGWIPVLAHADPADAAVFLAGVRGFTVAVPGYVPAVPDPETLHGRIEVSLVADPVAVRGVLVAAGESGRVECRLEPLDDPEGFDAQSVELPDGPGPFAISGLPPGRWRLVVAAAFFDGPGLPTIRWARREFVVTTGGADVGTIEVDEAASIRVRLRDPDGTVRDDPRFVAIPLHGVRPEYLLQWRRSRSPRYLYARGIPAGSVFTAGDIGVDAEGWTMLDSIEPGSCVLVASARWPGITREVRAPAAGQSLDVDLVRGPYTECRLQFTFGGREPMHLRGLAAGPATDDDFRNGLVVLEGDLVVGRHRVGVYVDFDEQRTELWFATLDVPDCGKWNTVVDLKPWPGTLPVGDR